MSVSDTSIDLKDYKRGLRRRVEIRAGEGEPLVITWQPDKVTDDYLRVASTTQGQLDELTDADMPSRSFILEIVERLILPLDTSWNLTDGGEPYPMTAETMADLGILIVRAINRELEADALRMMTANDAATDTAFAVVGRPQGVGELRRPDRPRPPRGDC